eukprot:SAG22_NODE_1709_length_3761_cov_9.920535_3_plen_106_part_00
MSICVKNRRPEVHGPSSEVGPTRSATVATYARVRRAGRTRPVRLYISTVAARDVPAVALVTELADVIILDVRTLHAAFGGGDGALPRRMFGVNVGTREAALWSRI